MFVPSKLGEKPCRDGLTFCVGCGFVRSHRSGKTFIGRISRGFDFLGYAFKPERLDAAPQAIERCIQRASQLYERGADLLHIGTYVGRWLRWTRSGLRDLGAGLSERAWLLVLRSLGRLGMLGGCLPPLLPAVAGPTVSEEGDGTDRRDDGGGGLRDHGRGSRRLN